MLRQASKIRTCSMLLVPKKFLSPIVKTSKRLGRMSGCLKAAGKRSQEKRNSVTISTHEEQARLVEQARPVQLELLRLYALQAGPQVSFFQLEQISKCACIWPHMLFASIYNHDREHWRKEKAAIRYTGPQKRFKKKGARFRREWKRSAFGSFILSV